MAFGDTGLYYHIFKDYNIQFDEKNSTCGTIRKAQWVKSGNEPDESKAKIEIRKIKIDEEGEHPLKGYSFSTEEGPHELTIGLIEAGFGKTKDILKKIRKREDFVESVKNINVDEDDINTSGEMFDMRDIMLGMTEESDEDE